MRAFAIAALAVAIGSAAARAEDNPACAKFVEPLAYNACLARQGPAAHGTRGIPEPRGDARHFQPRGETGRFRGAPIVTRTAKGRAHAVFTIR